MNFTDFNLPPSKMDKYLKIMIVLETVLLLGAYGIIMQMFNNIEQQKTERSIQQMNYTLSTNIGHTLDTLNTLTKAPISSDTYATVPSLWSYLISPAKREENPYTFEALFVDKYHQMNLLFPQLNAYFIFDPDGKILSYKYNNTRYFLVDDMPEGEWLTSLKESGGVLQIYHQDKLDSIGYTVDARVLYAGRWLYDIYSSQPAAIILAGVNISDICASFESQKLFESQEFYCFDREGTLLFASDGAQDIPLQQILDNRAKAAVDYQINYIEAYQVYSIIATEKKDITGTSFYLKLLFFLLLPIIIIFNLLIAMMITKNVIRSYSKMTEEVYQKTISEKDLNLQMLRSQINPHFLYNILDSMRMAAWNVGYDYLANMCELLAKILRYGVSSPKNLVTVEEEQNHLREYISLINIRYSNIAIHMNIDPSIYHCRMLKLLLQPLVENSVNHGIADHATDGMIQIWGFRKEDTLVFMVTDNGNGMDEKHLQLLRDYLDDKNHAFTSIGLKNIKKRIQLYYGEKYDLTIDSRYGQGTSVTITLPVIFDEEQQGEVYGNDK